MDQLKYYKTKNQRLKSAFLHGIMLIGFSYIAIIRFNDGDSFSTFISLIIIPISVFSLIKILMNQPTVIIDENGIKNNTNMMGLINWEYIEGFEIQKVMRFKILVIKVNKHEEFLKTKNYLSRGLMKTNIKKLGRPAVISELEFNIPLELVVEQINKFKNSYIKD